MTKDQLRLLIADDHKIVREGLKTLLHGLSDISVVGEAADGLSAIELTQRLQPHIVILDISMPEINGIEAARRILADNPGVRLIALSMHADRRFVLAALKAGFKGYLLKDSAFEDLTRAIRTVMNGQVFLSSTITAIVVTDLIRQSSEVTGETAFDRLSPREREILQMIAEGKSTKEIAARLQISVKTVETHRKQIMDKLDLHTVAELVKYAIKEGLTNL